MGELIVQQLVQWGLAGILVAAAGYLIYDNWRKNKRTDEWIQRKLFDSPETVKSSDTLKESIDALKESVDTLVSCTRKNNHYYEKTSMEVTTKAAPIVNSILTRCIEDCGLDHATLALLHNGTTTLSGIPYIKIGVVAEKYDPIKWPQDIDLIQTYKDENITTFGRLPSVIIQNEALEFDVYPGSKLAEIDGVIHNRCLTRGIKKIVFLTVKDQDGLCNGCLIGYTFTDKKIDMDTLRGRIEVIENVYKSMISILHG